MWEISSVFIQVIKGNLGNYWDLKGIWGLGGWVRWGK